MFYVYALKSVSAGKVYIGYTSDLKRRLIEHKTEKTKWGKDMGGDVELIYYEAYKNKIDAKQREFALKRHSGAYTHLKKRMYGSFNDSK